MSDHSEANSQLFADDMLQPIQKWIDAGADPSFISACLRHFADIIDRREAEKGQTND